MIPNWEDLDEKERISHSGSERGCAALGRGGVNRPLCSAVAAVDCVTRERKVRLLLEYQFDFIIFLFVSIVCPALSHHACPASGSSR